MHLRTMVTDGQAVFTVSTIERGGKLWFVPEWIISQEEGWQAPKRIICLDGLGVRPMPETMHYLADYQLPKPVPKDVLEGHTHRSESTEFVVIESPPIRFDIPKSVH